MPPLEGIRVLDLSRVLAGPYCAMMLGDLGADVIKVERPEGGDDSRSWGPPFVGQAYGPYPGESAYFMAANRNKRSITVNLKAAEGQQIVRQLASASDVLLENYRAGTLEEMGLGYETLHALNPRLVYCSISGYGRNGPYADRPGYDFIIQAEAGMMGITGPEEGPPFRVGIPIVDITAGMFAATAVLAALRARDLTGEGQFVDIALLDAMAALLTNVASNYLVGGAEPRRYGNAHPNVAPYEVFRARDRWFVLAAGNDRQWLVLCDAVGRPDLKQDPRFATNGGRVSHQADLRKILGEVFVTRDAEEWLQVLQQAGIPCGPINMVPDVFVHPQAESRNMVLAAEHSTAGTVRFPGFPYKLSATPAEVRLPPPCLGQHTDEVLTGVLGYSAADVAHLRESRAI
jgi:formyl-CoA transferase